MSATTSSSTGSKEGNNISFPSYEGDINPILKAILEELDPEALVYPYTNYTHHDLFSKASQDSSTVSAPALYTAYCIIGCTSTANSAGWGALGIGPRNNLRRSHTACSTLTPTPLSIHNSKGMNFSYNTELPKKINESDQTASPDQHPGVGRGIADVYRRFDRSSGGLKKRMN